MAVDVQVTRERQRRRRLGKVAVILSPLVLWMWLRILDGNPVSPGWPHLPAEAMIWLPAILIVLLIGVVILAPMLGSGRSPETIYLPEQIDVGFDDVKGLGPVLTEVRHTLEVFLNHQRFRDQMGGQPRRGVLFEGPPGTGKTHTAKAMAREAGVPFLFVSSTSFQSMWYGATARKIRSYFRRLRKVARAEGGAIGFIEEFDAIGVRRGGMSGMTPENMAVDRSTMSEGVGGVVNELLVQMQSFDEPPRGMKIGNALRRTINKFLSPRRQIRTKVASFANILLIGATNRADTTSSRRRFTPTRSTTPHAPTWRPRPSGTRRRRWSACSTKRCSLPCATSETGSTSPTCAGPGSMWRSAWRSQPSTHQRSGSPSPPTSPGTPPLPTWSARPASSTSCRS
jgi:hypothetical protein